MKWFSLWLTKYLSSSFLFSRHQIVGYPYMVKLRRILVLVVLGVFELLNPCLFTCLFHRSPVIHGFLLSCWITESQTLLLHSVFLDSHLEPLLPLLLHKPCHRKVWLCLITGWTGQYYVFSSKGLFMFWNFLYLCVSLQILKLFPESHFGLWGFLLFILVNLLPTGCLSSLGSTCKNLRKFNRNKL